VTCAHGTANAVVARTLRPHLDTVRRRRKRFTAEGLAALEDRSRPGHPRRYGPEVHLAIVATVTSARPAADSRWTRRAIADQAAEVCALHLHRPPGSVVLRADEKTAMRARSRRHPTRRAHPGRLERREFEYRRHGTASIVAALDVHTGQVLVEDITRNDSVTFIAFPRLLGHAVPADSTIHLILDNGSSHTSKATRSWLAKHPRLVVHHTPKHASWLNQVEISFSILARRLLRRGESDSRQDLVEQIREFTLAYDDQARSFRWPCDSTPLKAA
jgi:transposase